MKQIQTGIFRYKDSLITRNPVRGEKVYGERLFQVDGEEYREWVRERSKAAAAVEKGISLEIESDTDILYLGASTGTTVSHFSDIVEKGIIYAVEYSEDVARDLVSLAEKRDNIAPIIGDARNPEEYNDIVEEVDLIYQDISQRDQAEILLKNAEIYLKDNGIALLAVKARSISSTGDKDEVFSDVEGKLKEKFEIVDKTELEPYEKDHMFLKLRKK